MLTLSFTRVLIDGIILCVAFGVVVIGSLRFNPRLWLQDFPKPIREKVPPLTRTEKRQQRIVGVAFLVVMVGIPAISNALLRAENGGQISFLSAYLHTWLLLNLANLFDAVVLDWLYLAKTKPAYVIFPGTEELTYLYDDVRMHVINYLKGVVFCTLFSLPLAVIASL